MIKLKISNPKDIEIIVRTSSQVPQVNYPSFSKIWVYLKSIFNFFNQKGC